MSFKVRELSTREASRRLGVTPDHVNQLLRRGLLAGRKLPSGDWLTSLQAVEQYRATARRGRGRTLTPEAAWGVLWELSGLRATWLSSSTLSRLRSQIVTWSGEDIVRAVSSRTRVTRYASAREVGPVGLVLTGKSVAGRLGGGLRNRPGLTSGYVRGGTPAQYASRTWMTPDYEGEHSLFEWTLPIEFEQAQMPTAVIAADLARELVERERKDGVRAMEQIKRTWMESTGR